MIKKTITVEDVLEVLNRALEEDPEAINDLIEYRVECNTALGYDETIQTVFIGDSNRHGYFEVGILGILNGIFGTATADDDIPFGWGPIAAIFDSNKIVKFVKTKNRTEESKKIYEDTE